MNVMQNPVAEKPKAELLPNPKSEWLQMNRKWRAGKGSGSVQTEFPVTSSLIFISQKVKKFPACSDKIFVEHGC